MPIHITVGKPSLPKGKGKRGEVLRIREITLWLRQNFDFLTLSIWWENYSTVAFST